MKILKFVLIILIFTNIGLLSACKQQFGGLSINKDNITINETTFDTKNLKLIKSDPKGEVNYSIKVIGKTTPLSDYDWNKWFGEEESDIAGNIAVCLQLDYSPEIANDPNATITLPDSVSTNTTKTLKIQDIKDSTNDNNYIYLILNAKHDIVYITIDYTTNNKHKDIIYEIDMININSDSERLG